MFNYIRFLLIGFIMLDVAVFPGVCSTVSQDYERGKFYIWVECKQDSEYLNTRQVFRFDEYICLDDEYYIGDTILFEDIMKLMESNTNTNVESITFVQATDIDDNSITFEFPLVINETMIKTYRLGHRGAGHIKMTFDVTFVDDSQ